MHPISRHLTVHFPFGSLLTYSYLEIFRVIVLNMNKFYNEANISIAKNQRLLSDLKLFLIEPLIRDTLNF